MQHLDSVCVAQSKISFVIFLVNFSLIFVLTAFVRYISAIKQEQYLFKINSGTYAPYF